MNRLFLAVLVVFLWLCPARAQVLSGKGGELPLAVIRTPNFDVMHPPRLEAYARRVAAAAEAIRQAVIGIVGNDPGRTWIVVNDETDVFNGFAVPGPYPFIRVFATFPRPTDIGVQWQDAMHALVTHEFAHVAHLTTRDELRDNLRGIFGAIPSVLDARVPPAWFIEGLAVYVESQLTSGGRVQDSTVKTIRAQIARVGRFPSLSDAGIEPFEEYPFGNTRYAFGAGFVAYLMERFGENTVQRVIRAFNSRVTFAEAWLEVTDQSLSALWSTWEKLERDRAAHELEALRATERDAGTRLHAGSGVPAWLSKTEYAYMSGLNVRFARLEDGLEVLDERVIPLPSRPNRLSVANDGALVYSRIVARGATLYGEVFRLENGIERQLTRGARARDAVADGDCIVYVRDYLDDSSLWRLCPKAGTDQPLFVAPQGWHLFHPTLRRDLIALTVWRPGGFLDVAVLRGGQLELLTSDRAQDQFPTWLADDRIVFSSDRGGNAQLWTVTLGDASVQPISAAPGGVFASSLAPDGRLAFSTYTGSGLETRLLTLRLGSAQTLVRAEPRPFDNLSGLEYPVVPYEPNLAPVMWVPATTTGLGATVVGADAAGVLTYQLEAGFDLLYGTGFGTRFTASFWPALDWGVSLEARATQAGWGGFLAVPFTGLGESQATGRFNYLVQPSLTLDANGTTAAFFMRLGSSQTDDWGYLERGWSISGSFDTTTRYAARFSLTDGFIGLPLSVALGVQGDINSSVTLTLTSSTHVSIRPRWRTEDGFVGLERITFTPFLIIDSSGIYTVGTGILFDTVLTYYVPASAGFEVAYSSGNGLTFKLVTLLPIGSLR